MIQELIDAFDRDITTCLIETNSELIDVYDRYDGPQNERRCYINSEDNHPVHFELKNPTAANVVFAALDNCIFSTQDQSRCDFSIGNFQKLYFIEIKQVKRGQRSSARKDAIQQLRSAISIFREKIDLNQTQLIAVIALKARQVYPLQSATRVAEMVAFKEDFNASLMEGQSHTF